MNEPIALLLCGRALIATQLEERLVALRYRTRVVSTPADLIAVAEQAKAMVVLADIEGAPEPVLAVLEKLRTNPVTAHIPTIGFVREADAGTQAALLARGVAPVVSEAAMLSHLPQLLDRALDVQ